VGGDLGETVLDFVHDKSPLGFLVALDDVLDDVSALGVLEGSRNENLTHESSTTCPPSPFYGFKLYRSTLTDSEFRREHLWRLSDRCNDRIEKSIKHVVIAYSKKKIKDPDF